MFSFVIFVASSPVYTCICKYNGLSFISLISFCYVVRHFLLFIFCDMGPLNLDIAQGLNMSSSGPDYRNLFRLTISIEVMSTRAPTKFTSKWSKDVKDSPGNNNLVIDGDERNHDQSAIPEPCKQKNW
jgi:hypothetical protein